MKVAKTETIRRIIPNIEILMRFLFNMNVAPAMANAEAIMPITPKIKNPTIREKP